MKIEIIARVYSMQPPKEAKNGTYYQKFVLLKAAPTNDLQEKIGQDQKYEITAFSKTHAVIDPSIKVNDKVKAIVWLNGKEEWSGGKDVYYTLQLSLKEIAKL